ncbi:uncharacterized protein LOC110709312 [Chenopodium quinoa]|uniref:uncharacterized protein LOC110709312 n=1 Tax=Chenopodium quinoa TaxID=63459 RepID=UPI000B788568|nr:uncharacterized protein LOC110709312 [Chenopodium quinoa]
MKSLGLIDDPGNVTLRFWHGGKFKHVRNGELVYIGGEGRTYSVDPKYFLLFLFVFVKAILHAVATIAKSYNSADYEEALEELKELNPDAEVAFRSYNPKVFCRAFLDTSVNSDAITNNMAETFNGYIINARTKHHICMLEDIRIALMQRVVKKRTEMEKSASILCPRIQSKLEKEKTKAAECDVMPSSQTKFNVRYILDMLTVDLQAKSCTCKKWNMTGIPCCHAVACIFFKNQEAELYVDECFRKEVYLTAYAGAIPPLEGDRHWPRVKCNVDPPPH